MEVLGPGQNELYLRKDQNFYEQQPFSYLEVVARSRGLEISKVRALLPYVHKFEETAALAGINDDEAKEIIARRTKTIDTFVNEACQNGVTGRLRSGGHVIRGKDYLPQYCHFRDAFVEMAFYFKDFPKWYEYMQEYTGRFKPWARTGNPDNNFRWFTGLQIPTYSQWPVVKNQEQQRKAFLEERERRSQILLGIDEIFSDTHTTQERVQENVSKDGPRRSNRDWRVLEASELIKGK